MGRSWVPLPDRCGFPIESLPYGIAFPDLGERPPRAVVAIGEHALDLAATQAGGLFEGIGLPDRVFVGRSLNRFLALGPDVWQATRDRVSELLDTGSRPRPDLLLHQGDLAMGVPMAVGDYVDFYASEYHAANLGRILRPGTEPLLPNWRQLPVAYHGRTSTIVGTGSPIPRPSGLAGRPDRTPVFRPTAELDVEVELGFVIGVGNERGTSITTANAFDHIFGFVLVNDWSARDIQAFEYQPLGPHLGKSFATSVSPWILPLAALRPWMVHGRMQHPPVASYLRCSEPRLFDIHLELSLQSAAMRAAGQPPVILSRTNARHLYWSPAQMLAHLTVNGASTRPGDLFASGTVSGPEPGSVGSLIELTWQGRDPIELPDGTTRTFLADGDTAVIRGWCGDERASTFVALGEVRGTVV